MFLLGLAAAAAGEVEETCVKLDPRRRGVPGHAAAEHADVVIENGGEDEGFS